MPRRKQSNPTEAELEILNILWEDGPSTVRRVQEKLNEIRKTGYTTVLKLLQLMMEKGLVVRDESTYAHIYQARLEKEQTQRKLMDDLLERAFGGSAMRLVVQALSTRKASPEELAQIRKLLDDLEEENK